MSKNIEICAFLFNIFSKSNNCNDFFYECHKIIVMYKQLISRTVLIKIFVNLINNLFFFYKNFVFQNA